MVQHLRSASVVGLLADWTAPAIGAISIMILIPCEAERSCCTSPKGEGLGPANEGEEGGAPLGRGEGPAPPLLTCRVFAVLGPLNKQKGEHPVSPVPA